MPKIIENMDRTQTALSPMNGIFFIIFVQCWFHFC